MDDSTSITPPREAMKALQNLADDVPVVMLNMLKFRGDGGAAAYRRYGEAIAPILERHGGRVLYAGEAEQPLVCDEEWDRILLVEYPSRQAFLDMANSAEYAKIHHHRAEALERTVLYATRPLGRS